MNQPNDDLPAHCRKRGWHVVRDEMDGSAHVVEARDERLYVRLELRDERGSYCMTAMFTTPGDAEAEASGWGTTIEDAERDLSVNLRALAVRLLGFERWGLGAEPMPQKRKPE